MKVIANRNFSEQDGAELQSLIDPDGAGPWAVRYLWVTHRFNNQIFVDSYFTEGSQQGLNIRKQTKHLQANWDLHNRIFELSKDNGDLVWRFKVFNPLTPSIDYVEVWRSPEILDSYFGNRTTDDTVVDGKTWAVQDRTNFAESLWDAGFDLRSWEPWPRISKQQARELYGSFIHRWKMKDFCIVNTPWNFDLNPLE